MAKIYKEHYSCKNLIESLDADGLTPSFYIVCSPEEYRGCGKTYSFAGLLFEKFLKNGDKFILLTRNKGDLGPIAQGVFGGYLELNHPEKQLKEIVSISKNFSEIFVVETIDNKPQKTPCGYVIPLRAAGKIKEISSLFTGCTAIFFDEFQAKNECDYLNDEFGLLKSIYESVARGGGVAMRDIPIYMSSNTIKFGNPYFIALGLNRKIQKNTRFYRGSGVVYEQCIVEDVKKIREESAFFRACDSYVQANCRTVWINDNDSLVAQPKDWGRGFYICTLIYKNQRFGLYDYPTVGMVYISRQVDKNCKYSYNLTLDGALNIPLIKTSPICQKLRTSFYSGTVRCHDQGVQDMLLDVLA